MNPKIKSVLWVCLLLVALTVFAGCTADQTPYEINDAENFTVSIKYDANGGTFTTNTSVMVNSYDISGMKTNADGMAEIALLAPDDARRGNDAFTAINSGYFLAGWYSERTETLDEQGNSVYVYSGLWDFENGLVEVDPSKTYSAAEPVMTLYAAWVPLFEIEFYDLNTGEYLSSYTYDPNEETEILVPAWNTETGRIEMYDFYKKSGYTFSAAYYDAEGTQAVGSVVEHTGVVDYANGVGKNTSMKLYVDYMAGEWYHIYNVEQFLDNASVSGSYVIHEDLDFSDEIWPSSLMYGNFSGTIQGNGHTFRNIELTQTNNSKVNAGLFGYLTENARLEDLTLENVTFTIKAGTRVAGTSYGLLAGSISSGAALEGVQVHNSTLQIDSGCYFGVDDYVIGLLCGMGDPGGIDYSGISAAVVGDAPEKLLISVSGNEVALEFVSE